MNCPQCHSTLQMTDRHGVEIDYCPACRGVWLDRGELDKIIERAAEPARPRPENTDYQRVGNYAYRRDDDDDRRKYRKKGFLGELFDFD